MTIEEKTKKIKTAMDDIKDINDILENFDNQKANSVAFKVYTNLDYSISISNSRKKHKLPTGNILFENLHKKEKRKALKMYLDAVKDVLKLLEITPVENK